MVSKHFEQMELPDPELPDLDDVAMGEEEKKQPAAEEEDDKPEIQWSTKALIETIDGESYLNKVLKIHSTIGSGAFSKVKRVTRHIEWDEDGVHKEHTFDYALKIFNKSALEKKYVTDFLAEKPKTYLDNVYDEICLLAKLKHPNVARLYEVIDDEESNTLYTVNELCGLGQIMDWIPEKKEYKIGEKFYTEMKAQVEGVVTDPPISELETIALETFRQIAEGLKYLHVKKNIIHRDMKGENLLAQKNEDGKVYVKIIDFSISVEDTDQIFNDTAGTPEFLAPETSNLDGYKGKPTDIWGYGLCLYAFVFKKFPFGDMEMGVEPEYKLEFPADVTVSDELKDLIKSILEPDPEKRPTITDILAHAWFKKFTLPEPPKVQL